MSNVFGNRGGSGGFANPAVTNLDMNSIYKIVDLANGTNPKDAINLSQLTTYNPFNQSLNTTDNVQFQNVNMNGAWQIPNSQPSSPNDTNTYALSSRGGLLNITTNGANPEGQLHIRLALAPPNYIAVDIPIPSGYISTVDLCDYIQNYFNALNLGGAPGIVACSQCRFILNYFNIIITNSDANNGYWAQTYTLLGDVSGSVSELMGIVVNDTKIYTQTAVGTIPITLIAVVGWFSTNSSYPIQNGSPYIYSTAQDKWYCSDNLYTPDFLSYMDFNNSSYNLFQNGSNRLKINATDVYIYSPNALNYVNVSNAGMSISQSGIIRISTTAFSTYLAAPNVISNISVSNSGAALTVDTVARFSALSSGATTIKTADNQTTMTMTNTDITMTQGGFTKFSMNEDPLIGTSLWGPSGSGRIELLNARIALRQNSVNRFVVNNIETYSYSPSLLNYSYKSNTELASFYNSVNRFSIGAVSCALRSPDSANYIDISNTGFVYSDSGANRLSVSDASCFMAAPNMSSYYSVSNNGLSLTVDALARFVALSAGNTTIKSFDNTTTVILAGDAFTVTTTTNTLLLNADFNYSKGAQLRIHADSSHSQLLSPNGLQAVEANNNGVQINLGTDNYKLPTTRGTVGQVLTYSGINTTWASPGASNNAGFSLFSPLLSTGTIGSGNKAYWYIVMVPCNTVITGFKTALTTGSDPFHVGIYRGRTPNSATTILDLLAPITTVAGVGYYSAAFVVQSGRSNVYTAGEYITVMYHSQGSTNSFYNFIGISDTNIAYTSTANYGNAAPPANLGGVPILGTIANRLAIEFY